GHVVTKEDLEHLVRLGKKNLYVLEIPPDMMHEDEAVLSLAEALSASGVTYNARPTEGKINLAAAHDGLLKVNVEALTRFNLVQGVMCASRHTNTMVRQGEIVAGTRAIPLVIDRRAVAEAATVAREAGGVFRVLEMTRPLAGLVVTGSEIFEGLIQDKSALKVGGRLESFGCRVLRAAYTPDDPDFIARTIRELIAEGVQLVVATGGLSVDPDDVTALGVARAGAEDLLYGSSVLPGAMLLLARVENVPVIGVPACVLYHERTIFDLVLPRVLAGENLTRRDLAALAHGGLCLNCETCRFPVCPFGKGG
ncbi:MAG: molybdopterin-binding protein, partial [Thermodesulfobacteriota bacterium]